MSIPEATPDTPATSEDEGARWTGTTGCFIFLTEPRMGWNPSPNTATPSNSQRSNFGEAEATPMTSYFWIFLTTTWRRLPELSSKNMIDPNANYPVLSDQ